MKKRLYILLILIIAFIMAMPTAVFATAPPPANATRGTMTVEYRYIEGQAPSIPAEITRFGFRFYLVSQSAPIYAGELPAERSEFYVINGLLSAAQLAKEEADLAAQGLKARIVANPVKFDLRVEMDREKAVTGQATNDVEDLPNGTPFFDDKYVKDYLFGNNPYGINLVTGLNGPDDIFGITVLQAPPAIDVLDKDGKVRAVIDKSPDVVGVEFTRGADDMDGLPSGYDATVVYRGVVQFSVIGLTEVEIIFDSDENDLRDTWIIRAEYESDELPLPVEIVETEITDETVPLEPGGLTEEEQQQVENQTGNLGTDIVDGNVPLGNPGVTSTWSLISMILSIVALVILAVHAIGLVAKRKREDEEDVLGIDNEKLELIEKRATLYRILTIIVGAVTIVAWLYLDNLTLGVSWINAYTPIVGILFAITVVLLVFTKLQKDKARHEREKEHEAEANIA